MGATKQAQLEKAEAEHDRSLCLDCGAEKTQTELDSGHDFCFDCYCFRNSEMEGT